MRGEMENLVIDFSYSIVNINSWDYLEFKIVPMYNLYIGAAVRI